MARASKLAKAEKVQPSDEEKAVRRRAQQFANANFASISIVERGGELFMLTITDRKPNDNLVAIIHPK
jgi:hypothetical protein